MTYAHRVKPRHKIKLKDSDPGEHAGLKRDEAEKKTELLIQELVELQELLYAVRQQSVLVILQGRDTSGKDGVIRHVAGPLDSQGCAVASFKVPTEDELAHDFLWRVHAQTPAAGQIKIFNRSQYEDVLVVRVHKLAPKKIWRSRYDHINAFERLLADSSTIILKFYLHISKEEQENGSSNGNRIRLSHGSSLSVIGKSALSGTITPLRTRTRSTVAPQNMRPGSSCLPIRSGFGICP
jgi:polyphosphate kinase 2 (PPK2 family)